MLEPGPGRTPAHHLLSTSTLQSSLPASLARRRRSGTCRSWVAAMSPATPSPPIDPPIHTTRNRRYGQHTICVWAENAIIPMQPASTPPCRPGHACPLMRARTPLTSFRCPPPPPSPPSPPFQCPVYHYRPPTISTRHHPPSTTVLTNPSHPAIPPPSLQSAPPLSPLSRRAAYRCPCAAFTTFELPPTAAGRQSWCCT